jgi:hypothetical protein
MDEDVYMEREEPKVCWSTEYGLDEKQKNTSTWDYIERGIVIRMNQSSREIKGCHAEPLVQVVGPATR